MNYLLLACRRLLRNPRLAIVVLLSVAVGLGAVITLFDVIRGPAINSGPLKDPSGIWPQSIQIFRGIARVGGLRGSSYEWYFE